MQQTSLLVAVSLVMPFTASSVDKHKQSSGRSGQAKRFTARAYSSGRLTSLGEVPVAGKTIAADPKVIPMGARVRISGAGGYSGVYRVGDVGANIKGKKIDVYVKSYNEAIQFGRREVEVTVLSVPRRPVKYARQKAIIGVDEARGSRPSPAQIVSTGTVGDSTGEGDSRESRGTSTFAGLPSLEGTSSH